MNSESGERQIAETTYRPMTIDDYAEVYRLWQSSEGVGLGTSDGLQEISRFLARNPDLSQIATVDGQVAGAVLAGHDGRRGYLHHLAVSAEFQRRGIARGLVERCCEQFAEQGIQKCNVFVYKQNVQGRAFWQHIGWNGRDDLIMMQVECIRTDMDCGC
jgi:ribosomal protein S18 acetylase RimI-like enzyme